MPVHPGTTISGSSQALITTSTTYFGFTLKETTGTQTAAVTLWDNNSDPSGAILDEITLAANESARELYPAGIQAMHGVYVQIVSGSVAGAIRAGG